MAAPRAVPTWRVRPRQIREKDAGEDGESWAGGRGPPILDTVGTEYAPDRPYGEAVKSPKP